MPSRFDDIPGWIASIQPFLRRAILPLSSFGNTLFFRWILWNGAMQPTISEAAPTQRPALT
jgi:hypothetical protein